MKKKITYFLKNYVSSLAKFFEKFFAICEFFYRSVLKCKVLKSLIFLFVWSSIHSIGIFFFAGRKYVDLVVISNIERGRNFCGTFTKSQKLCLHKIFNTGLTTKVNCLEFYVFILDVHKSSIAKKFFISQFLEQIKFYLCLLLFKESYFHLIMFMFMSWRLLEQYIKRVRVFIYHFLRMQLV